MTNEEKDQINGFLNVAGIQLFRAKCALVRALPEGKLASLHIAFSDVIDAMLRLEALTKE